MSNESKTEINDWERAFPSQAERAGDSLGMSLRDYFAAKAMHGFLSNPESIAQLADEIAKSSGPHERRAITINKVLAKRGYMLADAMLEARAE